MNHELNAVLWADGSFHLEWNSIEDSIDKNRKILQEELYKHFLKGRESFFLLLGFCDKSTPLSISLEYWRDFASCFGKKLTQTPDLETLKEKADIPPDKKEIENIYNKAPLMTGAEYLSVGLLESFWKLLNNQFKREIKNHKGSVESYIKKYSADVHLIGRIYFHMVENKNGEMPFAFLATYSTRLNEKGKSKHLPLKYALTEYKNDKKKLLELLSTVHMAATKSDFISMLLENGELFHPIAWSSRDALTFLKETPIYEESGILCRIPDWWKSNASKVRLGISAGDAKPSRVGMDAILSFHPKLFIGDGEISALEARKLLDSSEGLAFIKNKWVAVDEDKLKQTLDAYDKAKKIMDEEGFSLKEALKMQLNPQEAIIGGLEDTEISNGQWLESVFEKLHNPELISSVSPENTFKAKLRPYQQKGLNWLSFLHSLQFGACLADDMGLGKTIQLLGFLNTEKLRKVKKASLLIMPASLLSNWAMEIEKFSPEMKVYFAHPGATINNRVESLEKESIDTFDVVITTYQMAQKYEWIKSYTWNYVILDEAQAIKNPGTKQARAIKRLLSINRIIMTGTPMENSLSDLWSLFDFLNPGLLGTLKEFSKFSKSLKDKPDGYSKLRKIISPYILRRLKTDKSVISDLPEKIEMKTYSSLSKKQVLLYGNLVNEIEELIESTNGIQRRGIILASIMKFKQLCNHPDQYLGNKSFDENESGKFIRLREICNTIFEKREKVLIFTQFKEMTEPLAEFLSQIFKREGLVLHGSTPIAKRKKIIEKFQSPEYIPFLVLSLKAGGVGLNLTQANHVVHFDRWWNPAVENQATDRAFRIGQKKNVIVHKFLSKGTIEEKIDLMLEDKSKLSKDIIQGSNESWITEMDNKKIMDLFSLSFKKV